MCHKIKKKPLTLTKLRSRISNHQLLHSDKSTYFYNGKVRELFSSIAQTICHCAKAIRRVYQSRIPFRATILAQSSRMAPYRAMTGWTASSIPLVLAAFGLLLVLGFMTVPAGINSFSSQDAYALQGEILDGGIPARSTEETTSPSISLTLPDYIGVTGDINLPATEVTSGVGYITVDFNVEAKELDKYDVYVQSSTSSLIGAKDKDVIASISTDTTAEAMKTQDGKWGYSVVEGASANPDTLTYKPIRTDVGLPAAGKAAAENTKLNLTQAYTLAFAANLTGAKVDHYKSNIILSVAANAEETVMSNIGFGSGDNKATYMQDVNKTFCDKLPSVTSNDNVIEGRLIDKRDGKVYWVAKLKDNNCWMTQNLDLDLAEGEVLTSDLSDVTNWDPGNGGTTLISGQLNNTNWPNTEKIVRSYDSGFHLLLDGKTDTPADAALFYDLQYGITHLAWTETRDEWFIGVTSYLGTDGKTICTKAAGSMVGDLSSSNPACRIYYYDYFQDMDYSPTHYAQGNYYSWVAAKAGSSTTSLDTSICPRGWKLPLGSGSNVGSFVSLGLTKDSIYVPPHYFIFGGHVYNSNMASVGDEGWYWSATSSGATGYTLFFTQTSVNASNTSFSNSFYGCSVRCVAR